jgi:hypothetical protein
MHQRSKGAEPADALDQFEYGGRIADVTGHPGRTVEVGRPEVDGNKMVGRVDQTGGAGPTHATPGTCNHSYCHPSLL